MRNDPHAPEKADCTCPDCARDARLRNRLRGCLGAVLLAIVMAVSLWIEARFGARPA